MREDLSGADYRAVYRLANGDDDVTYAEIGETCEHVPAESLAGLLAHGYIAPVRESLTIAAADVGAWPLDAEKDS